MKIIIETEHLILREFNLDDAAFILQLLNSPGWLKYIGNRDIETTEEAQLYLLTGPINSYQKQGFGLYLVVRKSDNMPLGMCGLIKREGLKHTDLGFAFITEFIGKGYAHEAAAATVKHAATELRLKKLDAITLPENNKAITLLQKLGFVYQNEVVLPNETKPLMLYTIALNSKKVEGK